MFFQLVKNIANLALQQVLVIKFSKTVRVQSREFETSGGNSVAQTRMLHEKHYL